jgi:hypothetical protein
MNRLMASFTTSARLVYPKFLLTLSSSLANSVGILTVVYSFLNFQIALLSFPKQKLWKRDRILSISLFGRFLPFREVVVDYESETAK